MSGDTMDARGAWCPGPLMSLIARIKEMDVGDEVEVLSSDQGSYEEIPEWCAKVGHEVVDRARHDDYVSVTVRRAK